MPSIALSSPATLGLAPSAARARTRRAIVSGMLLGAATLFAFLIIGYHPVAEDGGIYAAATEAKLNPALFPHDRLWVLAHTRYAWFVPAVAAVTAWLHLPLARVLLALQAMGLFGLLATAAHLACTVQERRDRPWLPLLLVAAGAGLPVAGTALYAVDPYSTGRTVATPLLLLALSFALRTRWPACALCWTAAAAMHPLMALWGALPLLLTAALTTRNPRRWILTIAATAMLAAALVNHASAHETPGTRQIAHTRAYWFPAQWQWYEWGGAAAPCLLLLVAGPLRSNKHRLAEASPPQAAFRHLPDQSGPAMQQLTLVIATTTAIAVAIAVCFACETAQSLFVARLQPLRSLYLVFLAFLVAGGALLQGRLRAASHFASAITACVLIAAGSFAMQRSLYSHTPHLEWPWSPPGNAWQQAFAWCRDNTPADALFALDSGYITEAGEDSHGFRAAAHRSALPDEVKDAGIAAVLPSLTASWQSSVAATHNLGRLSDRQRSRQLAALGVGWMVLPAAASTAAPCPYRNRAVQVCRVPRIAAADEPRTR